MTSDETLGNQFNSWKMSPTMKSVFDYMKTKHVGVANRENLWEIAARTVTDHKGQDLTNAKHSSHFEALNRLADNGLVKIHNDYEDTAWIPKPGEEAPEPGGKFTDR